MGQVIEGVKEVVNFLRDVQSRGVFQKKIPVLNRSLADLLDTADKLDALSTELETNPPKTINEAIPRINTVLVSAGTTVSFQRQRARDRPGLRFQQVRSSLDLGFDLDDQLNAGVLEEFLDSERLGATDAGVRRHGNPGPGHRPEQSRRRRSSPSRTRAT